MSEEQEVPQREQQTHMTCCCRMKWVWADGSEHWDSCWAVTSGPDEPICQGCVAQGHPQLENFDPILKPARFDGEAYDITVVKGGIKFPAINGFVNYEPQQLEGELKDD